MQKNNISVIDGIMVATKQRPWMPGESWNNQSVQMIISPKTAYA